MDRISRLPSGIIETILSLLPIQEAGRTSILSKGWRYHWTKIPKLAFIENTFQVSSDGAELSVLEQTFDQPSKRKKMANRCKLFNAIHQVLLMHEGPIHEFTLCMEIDDSCVEIDHILLHLLKSNTVKILKLDFLCEGNYKGYTLPSSLFSLHQLTNLYLDDCAFFHEHSVKEFGCLTTLHLGIWTNEKALLRLLSGCPLLERLTIDSNRGTISDSGTSIIVDLFECLPRLEYLSISLFLVMCFAPDRLPKVLPTALINLKCLCMDYMCFTHIYGLAFLVLLIRSSPKLEKLVLVMGDDMWFDDDEKGSCTLEDCSDIMLEHLSELEIIDFNDTENELAFVKLILAKSPMLKKVTIILFNELGEDEDAQISKILLSSPCASPMAEIIVSCREREAFEVKMVFKMLHRGTENIGTKFGWSY